MSFPLDYRGRIVLSLVTDPELFVDEFMLYANKALLNDQAKNIAINGAQISFSGSFFDPALPADSVVLFVTNGFFEVSFTKEETYIDYYVSFDYVIMVYVFIACLALLGLFYGGVFSLANVAIAFLLLITSLAAIHYFTIIKYPLFINEILVQIKNSSRTLFT
jgi:hypothetical protein